MKLYYAPGACSLASHIVLQETGLPFEIDKLNTANMTTSSGEDFAKINPKGYVPTLEMNDGSILTEGSAILQYIADQNPDSGLAPKAGTMERYRLQEWLNYIATEIHKSYSPLFSKTTPEETKINVRNMLTKRLGFIEDQLVKKLFLTGDGFTVADAYLFVVLNWSGRVGYDLSQFPKITEYISRIAKRPGVVAAMKAEGLIK
jgi:glutathione S-transferase